MPITRVKLSESSQPSSPKKTVAKKTKTAKSPKTGALPKAVAAEDYQNIDKEAVDIKKSVNSQVLMRGAASAIKKLGAHPIALIGKYAVLRGPLVLKIAQTVAANKITVNTEVIITNRLLKGHI
jgi:hypothetical protein